MRSRTIREGSVGLLFLLGFALFGGLILWIRGFDLNRRGYRFTIEFTNIAGMELGAPVRYRGVAVGRTVAVQPDANIVAVEVEVKPATLLIPQDSVIQVIQTGLIGETYIDIAPNVTLPQASAATNPLSDRCDSSTVVCDGDRLEGLSGVSFSELIGSITRFTNLFSNPEVVDEIRTLTRNSADAADGVADLSREVSSLSRLVQQELGPLSDAATGSIASVGQAADTLALTSAQVNELITSNRTALITTLDNINGTTQELQTILGSLSPMLNEGGFVTNLEALSLNAAEASANLRNLTTAVGSTENLLLLQQTLESARSTFQNVQKITADLDELTGDPSFRDDIRNLIDNLGNLVSATQTLHQRAQLAQLLNSADVDWQSSQWQAVPSTDAPNTATRSPSSDQQPQPAEPQASDPSPPLPRLTDRTPEAAIAPTPSMPRSEATGAAAPLF
jgi:phospholipid/cholesterol/gamma-HCH transport system substrate-binding protein